jgi:predicted phosphodiesterase
MKIRYLSDLHLEHFGYQPEKIPSVGEDVVVLAGDIGVGAAGVRWASTAFADRRVIYVLGNHEFYGQDWRDTVDQCRHAAQGTSVSVLENDAVVVDGFRFLGCTLWTDFRLFGPDREQASRKEATDRMMDFYAIRTIDHGQERNLTTSDMVKRHLESAAWLSGAIDSSREPVVVVTHHGASLQACALRYWNDLLTAAFFSNLEDLFRGPVRAWIHGHTHDRCETEIRGIPLLINPRGYPGENSAFYWDAIVEVRK